MEGFNVTKDSPMAAPPEAVEVGESVPHENSLDEMEEAAVQSLVAEMKTRPAFNGKSDDELREIAKEKLL